MKSNTNTPIMTVDQMAKLFSVKETTVRKWAKEKRIPAFKIGKRWFFNRIAVLEKQSP